MKLISSVLIVFFAGLASYTYSQDNAGKQPLQVKLAQPEKLVFYAPETPELHVLVSNEADIPVSGTLVLTVKSDKREHLFAVSREITLNGGDSVAAAYTFELPAPGFYRCSVSHGANGKSTELKNFNIGYEPESIVSLPDHQPDFHAFWQSTLEQLAAVAPDYKLTLLPERSSSQKKTFLVTMKSFGGVEISGYYCVPVKKGKHPVIVSYMGYGANPYFPDVNENPGVAQFVLSVRGQALNKANNVYGDWMTYGLESKESYYYRGAFMDLVRAVDFVASRPEIDTGRIIAEGGSQGGAFTLIACALDRRIALGAPFIPFLSDFPDYFDIVERWPTQPIRKKQAELGISNKQLLETLSYFDVKNFTGLITCPIVMAVGLQDEVCPPHTNFAGYNRIRSPKKYYIYPLTGHDVPKVWWKHRNDFFESY